MKKIYLKLVIAVVLIGLLTITYMWFKPHRNVASIAANEEVTVEQLTARFTKDAAEANTHFLSNDGNSKILLLHGIVNKTFLNAKGEPVVFMKTANQETGVQATFIHEDSLLISKLKKGDPIRLKGVIIAGNQYDSVLDFHEPALLVQCTISNN